MMHQIDLKLAIQSLKQRRGNPSPETARFTIEMIRLIAQGNPVSAEIVADTLGFSMESVKRAFEQLKQSNFEFDSAGNLRGAILTQIPTPHQIRVNGLNLYAWCALDTLFLPAYLETTATIHSTCPITNEVIHAVVSPDGIESFSPKSIVLSIVIPDWVEACDTRDGFCNKIYFFSSPTIAQQWAKHHQGIAIFSLEDAYQIAQEVYIKPFLEQLS